ncbi:hypothetical protein M1466_02570 [Candidatus Dependentiae bacterium]|nr:hypothetical protein [Candidatus Dependentiae bacterium]
MKRLFAQSQELAILSLQKILVKPGYHIVSVLSADEASMVYDTVAFLSKFKKTAYICPINLPYATETENIYSLIMQSVDTMNIIAEFDIVVVEERLCQQEIAQLLVEQQEALRDTAVCVVR